MLKKELNQVTIMHINVRSIKKNLDNLEALILGLESPPSVLCLSETWLKENDDPKCYLIQGYNQLIVKTRIPRGRWCNDSSETDYTLKKKY